MKIGSRFILRETLGEEGGEIGGVVVLCGGAAGGGCLLRAFFAGLVEVMEAEIRVIQGERHVAVMAGAGQLLAEMLGMVLVEVAEHGDGAFRAHRRGGM